MFASRKDVFEAWLDNIIRVDNGISSDTNSSIRRSIRKGVDVTASLKSLGGSGNDNYKRSAIRIPIIQRAVASVVMVPVSLFILISAFTIGGLFFNSLGGVMIAVLIISLISGIAHTVAAVSV